MIKNQAYTFKNLHALIEYTINLGYLALVQMIVYIVFQVYNLKEFTKICEWLLLIKSYEILSEVVVKFDRSFRVASLFFSRTKLLETLHLVAFLKKNCCSSRKFSCNTIQADRFMHTSVIIGYNLLPHWQNLKVFLQLGTLIFLI